MPGGEARIAAFRGDVAGDSFSDASLLLALPFLVFLLLFLVLLLAPFWLLEARGGVTSGSLSLLLLPLLSPLLSLFSCFMFLELAKPFLWFLEDFLGVEGCEDISGGDSLPLSLPLSALSLLSLSLPLPAFSVPSFSVSLPLPSLPSPLVPFLVQFLLLLLGCSVIGQNK